MHLDDVSQRIVRCAAELAARSVEPTPQVVSEWLRLAVSDVERRMAALQVLGQLPDSVAR